MRTITAPAETAGLQLDPDLAQELLQDVRARQALPLLAFALRELWERRSAEGRLLTASYVTDLGRIEGAVKRAAEAATKSVIDNPADAEALRIALLEMIQISTDGSILKRQALRSGLPAQSTRGIDALEAARLLVADGDFVEPAHEALFGAWNRLADWVKEARAALMVRTEAQTDAALWESSGRRPEYLWAEARLDRAKRLLATQRIGATDKSASFLVASTKAVEEQHRKDLAERDRELTRLRRQRLIVGGFAGGALAAAAVAISFYIDARNAEAESNNSLRTSRLQTARVACRDVTVGARDTGIQALQEAAKIRPGDDLRTALVDCLQRPGLRELSERQGVSEPPSLKPGDPLVDQVGTTKATLRPAAEKDKFIIAVERDGAAQAAWPLVASEADSLRLSPDGAMVGVMRQGFGLADQTLEVFESRTGKTLWSFRVETASLGHWSASAGRISFSASGRYIAAAGNAGSILAWDLSPTNGPVAALQSRPFSDQAMLTAVSPDGRWVAAMDEKDNLVVVETETNEVVGTAPHAGTTQAFNSSVLEWTSQDRIVVGAKQWQWLPPVDRGFWARSNIGRQRSIRDVVFGPQGTMLGVATEYGGMPYVLNISAREARMHRPLATNGEFPSGVESLAFSGLNGSVCGARLSAILCWQVDSGSAQVLSDNNFSRWYRQLNADDDRVVAAGERNITLLEALDIKGNLLWQRTIERTSMFGLKAVFDDAGQRMAFRSTDSSTSLDVIALTDGATVETHRKDDPNEALLPVSLGDGFALLDTEDVSLRALSDGALLSGPYAKSDDGRINSDMVVRGKAIVERSRTGQMTFWTIGGSRCSPKSVVQPRNQAIALSSSGAHFAAFDGEVLKVWTTATCEAVDVPTSADGSSISSLTFTPDDQEIRFRSASNEITTYTLGTKQVSRTVFKPFASCEFEVGSGWSGDAGTLWQACRAGKSTTVKAWRATDGGSAFEVTVGAESQRGVTVLVDPKQHTIIVRRELTKPGIWGWSLPGGSTTETDLCRSVVAVEGSAKVQLFDRGASAAFFSQAGKDGAQINLNMVDTRSCKSSPVTLPSADAVLGTTSSGAFVVSSSTSIKAVSRDGQVEWTSLETAGRIRRSALAADGKLVAAALDDGSIAVGTPGRAEPIFRFTTGPGEVNALALSPDGSWLAAGTEAGRVHLWPLAALDADVAATFRADH
ncbi:WD40 repeat domain-containing protein [Bradyrhizobium ontarionense]|uniref:WD40 repeat domain-containing protein n=1 Tax=Bradyrhizobium ontarionense TaxID=2898149 RepID=A0ABY3RLJ5_9BRAD|nr:WD40 repeat domain-containing protein [Bradyrhizobium sp. A19]UFZ07623.1 WD40 repeat domain-containing protein [Bradyrhizobium sp. A19]